MHKHVKIDIPVIDSFIKKFAELYLQQRSQTQFDINSLNEQALFKNLDVRELSLALHKARVNADFPLIEEYCQWVAKTARIDLFRLFV